MRRASSFRVALALAIALPAAPISPGCAQEPLTQPTPSSRQRDSESSGASARGLDSALTFREVRKGRSAADAEALPQGIQLPHIDYQSQLLIEPDEDRLRGFASSAPPVLPPLTPEQQVLRQEVPALLAIASNYLDKVELTAQALRAASAAAAPTGPGGPTVLALQALIREQGILGSNILARAEALARAQAQVDLANQPDRIEDRVAELVEPLLLDAAGQDVVLNLRAFSDLLARHTRRALALANNDVTAIERGAAARLRIRAWVIQSGKDPLAAHVVNYDDITDPMPAKEPRVSYRMSPNDQARVEEGYQIARNFSDLHDRLRRKDSEEAAALRSLGRTLQRELRQLPTNLGLGTNGTWHILPPTLTNVLDRAIRDVAAWSNAPLELRAKLTALPNDLAQIQMTETSIRKLQALADKAPEDFLEFFTSFRADLEFTVTNLVSLVASAASLPARIEGIQDGLSAIDSAAARQLLDDLAREFTSETAGQLVRVRTLLLERHPHLATALTELINGGPALGLARGILDARVDPRVRTLALDQVVPGAVNLNNLPADRRHQLLVKTELILPAGDATATTSDAPSAQILSHEQTFAVDRFGLVSGFSAHLSFVDRLDGDTEFEPAPSVSWTLHYRLRNWHRPNGWKKFYSALDPGLGINAAALHFEQNFEVGIGAHVTLFSDLLQFGYGYNLSTSRDPAYVFAGIGILEALDGAGHLFRQIRSDARP